MSIRNFCVIAHIDHGKSTLCDRFLEITGTVEKRKMQSQLLDSNPIERERGITIKLAPVRMIYHAPNPKFEYRNSKQIQNINSQNPKRFEHLNLNNLSIVSDLGFRASNFDSEYILNLIDTPGHIDFSYEVSRSLAACEGAIVVVDATQGVQAQTIGNTLKAIEQGLVVVPVINKIDLPNADIESTKKELVEIFGFKEEEIILVSAKTGENCEKLLQEVIKRVPPPHIPNVETRNLRALIFNSFYDSFKGVVIEVKVVSGEINIKDFNEKNTLKFLATRGQCVPIEVGYFKPQMEASGIIKTGEVGYVATGLKDLSLAQIGDTAATDFGAAALPGYTQPKPFVFAGLFPIDNNEFIALKSAIEKLKLKDSALVIKPITSAALGNGYHAGFLGMLHCEIVKERLNREFNLQVIVTSPTVEYKIILEQGAEVFVDNPTDFPTPEKIREIYEPIATLEIFTPEKFLGGLITLCEDKRGKMINMEYFKRSVKLTYKIPFGEIISDFYDRLKSISSGFASVSYEISGFSKVRAEKVDILLNAQKIDALSFIAEKSRVEALSRAMVEKLQNVIPRQQYKIAIQAAIGGKVIARADVNPFRKDVLKKMSGGDRSRKDKLLEAQKKGKKKMKQIGRVAIPQEAFFEVFKR